MKKLITLMMVVVTVNVFAWNNSSTYRAIDLDGSTVIKEQAATEENQSRLFKRQPPVKLDRSLERDQINKRTTLWNDPNRIGYVTLIDHGIIVSSHTVKGKVSSVNSQVTNPQQIKHLSQYGPVVMDSPAEDGSYGTNGDGIFFFDMNGEYIEWAGTYRLTTYKPRFNQEPLFKN